MADALLLHHSDSFSTVLRRRPRVLMQEQGQYTPGGRGVNYEIFRPTPSEITPRGGHLLIPSTMLLDIRRNQVTNATHGVSA